MTTQSNNLREDVKFRILRLLQDNPEMSQRELAKAVSLSTGGIHYVLNALLDKVLLKIENPTTTEDTLPLFNGEPICEPDDRY